MMHVSGLLAVEMPKSQLETAFALVRPGLYFAVVKLRLGHLNSEKTRDMHHPAENIYILPTQVHTYLSQLETAFALVRPGLYFAVAFV
jgi:hypothetical protein